ncbi:hypothetical protein [Mesorhizobium sp. M4A.F.Ca.ET.020.02.1.1]|uniref:hypothetical protein n=1 Tax=Mesorhizobium sp. M4A.F.Ca.ET.020.02.1.1 TaxID=2496652 RepID=UPI001675659E|nr:hypothetical protein [Mesorhizobium sp. M4A.F.Ca.ET.020.02.1.1]
MTIVRIIAESIFLAIVIAFAAIVWVMTIAPTRAFKALELRLLFRGDTAARNKALW